MFSSFGSFGFPPRSPQSPHGIIIQKSSIGTSRSLLREYKKTLTLSNNSAEACVGMMLGDASLQSQDTGKTHRLKFEVGEHNLPYLQHIKTDVLHPFILGEPRRIVRTNKNNNSVVTYQLQTLGHQSFNFLEPMFFAGKQKKSVHTQALEPFMTPRCLAFWFMDDGGKLDYSKNQGKGIVLNTQGFTEAEVQDLCTLLTDKFAFTTWPKRNKNHSVVAISGKDYEKFVQLTGPHIIPAMAGKLPGPRKS